MLRFELINDYIQKRGYKSYLEIGVENPNNCFNHVYCEKKVSVDPYLPTPYVNEESSEALASQVTYRLTSDDFFAQNTEKFDIIFIDALHTEEQCDKDVANALKVLNPYGVILLHDSLPENERLQSDEAFENGEPWNGTVWKTVKKLIDSHKFDVKTYYHDWGIAAIEARECDNGITYEYNPNELIQIDKKYEDLNYKDDFSIVEMNLEFSFVRDTFKVSYFTPAYKSKYIEHTYQSLKAQTDPRWEWVVLDDSPQDYHGVYEIVSQLQKTDHRVKYFRMYPNSGGFIGRVKHRAVSLCEGILVAELDHDDEIADITTELLLKLHSVSNSDFYYTDSYTYTVENGETKVVDYPDGFAMGYGSYKEADMYVRWLDKHIHDRYVVSPNINPKTIRHIVGVPNHLRVWKRSFIDTIDSYDVNMPHCDDYELIVRTFVNGAKMTKIDMPLYYQFMNDENSQYGRLMDIQNYVKAVSNYYHTEIAERFQNHFDKSGLNNVMKTLNGDEPSKPIIFDYVYERNNKDCNGVVFVQPPELLVNLSYNDVITEKQVKLLLCNKNQKQ